MIQNADPTGDASGDPPELLSLEGTLEPRFTCKITPLSKYGPSLIILHSAKNITFESWQYCHLIEVAFSQSVTFIGRFHCIV